MKEELIFNGMQLSRHTSEAWPYVIKDASYAGRTYRMIMEPGDATRYDFLVIDYEYCYLIVSDCNIVYPSKVPKYLFNETNDYTVKAMDILIESYPECNPYTLWAVLDACRHLIKERYKNEH